MNAPAAQSSWIDRFTGLSRLEPAIKDVLIDRSRVVKVPAGTVIFGPGKAPDNLLLLLEGTVRAVS
jgi:CRP/FNR family transcriptional regulator